MNLFLSFLPNMMLLACFLTLFSISNAAVLPKIIGGSNTTIEKVPWAVILNTCDVIHCGGSIISKNYILTTASCISPLNEPADFVIRSGTTFLTEGGTETEVESISQHPSFDTLNFDYDVAILKLKTPLNISDVQKPVPLSLKTIKAGSVAQVAGWGTSGPGTGYSKVIQSALAPVVDQQDCVDAYAIYRNVTERMVCAGAVGLDACTADGGDGLTVDSVLFGILSWGNGCGLPGFPGVYANMPALKEFIDENSNGEASWV